MKKILSVAVLSAALAFMGGMCTTTNTNTNGSTNTNAAVRTNTNINTNFNANANTVVDDEDEDALENVNEDADEEEEEDVDSNANVNTSGNTNADDDEEEDVDEEEEAVQINTVTVTYNGSTFSPATVTINAGDSVKFVNSGSRVMQVSSDDHPSHRDNAELGTGPSTPVGGAYTINLNKVGTWGYHDHLKSTVGGTIIVQ